MSETPIEKIRIHSISFSEEEYHKLIDMIQVEIEEFHVDSCSQNLKTLYPEVWKFMNRMSYIVSHGTEAGWDGA